MPEEKQSWMILLFCWLPCIGLQKKSLSLDIFLQLLVLYFVEYQKQPYYNKYRVLIQSFSIFKEINSNWNYVNDPDDKEYFAKASETVNLMAGDCDDHTVFMTACIKAIGGKTRMILTTGHIYPEIYIGDMIINLNELKHISNNKEFEKKLNKLWIHGLIHLFGYEHKSLKDFKSMNKIEKKYLQYIN